LPISAPQNYLSEFIFGHGRYNQAGCPSKNHTVPDEVLHFDFKFIPALCQFAKTFFYLLEPISKLAVHLGRQRKKVPKAL
jgi:hypothetical protein